MNEALKNISLVDTGRQKERPKEKRSKSGGEATERMGGARLTYLRYLVS